MLTTCIDLFTKILVASVIYLIQSSSGVLEILVHELQDLFTLAETILIIMQQMISSHYCNKDTVASGSVPLLVILFFLLLYEYLDNFFSLYVEMILLWCAIIKSNQFNRFLKVTITNSNLIHIHYFSQEGKVSPCLPSNSDKIPYQTSTIGSRMLLIGT